MEPKKTIIPEISPATSPPDGKIIPADEDKARRIQQKLEESEKRFRTLVTATADVIYRMSPDWLEIRELEAPNKNTGNRLADWLHAHISPDDQELVLRAIQQAVANKSIFELEHRVLLADGSLGYAFSRAVPLLDDDGAIVEWFGTTSDITARKTMESVLRAEKEQSDSRKRLYETVTNNTPDLIYVFDPQYRFIYANEALLSMWGMTWEEANGKLLLEIGYEPWHAEMHEREIDHVTATKQPIRGEVSFPHAVLGKRIYDYIFVPVINEQGEVEAVAGTTRDITDIRLAEEALKRNSEQLEALVEERTRALHRSNEDLQQFAHVASHDLKEPVRKIALFANLLKDECSQQLDEKGIGFLNTLQRSAIRMYAMIDDILAYSSFQAMEMQKEHVDLNHILRDITGDLEMLIRQKQATLQYQQLPVIEGSALLLFQLFSNLISNAIKFSRPDAPPVITITAQPLAPGDANALGLNGKKDHVQIVLQDNGIGFSQEYAETIFQTFTRLNTKDKFEGTGLGLALCRKIVERHGGIIKASGVEQEGATFTILLPLQQV